VHVDTVTHTGSDFVQVEYAQMDDKPGMEIVVGCQLSDQLLRTMAVYSFNNGQMEQRMTASYTRFMTAELDTDGFAELFVLHPGEQVADYGVAEVYEIENGIMERSNEVAMSQSVDKLKRIKQIIESTGKNIEIMIDGNTTAANTKLMVAAGATGVVAGTSSLMRGVENFEQSYNTYMKELAEK